jgi:hypothetical protein
MIVGGVKLLLLESQVAFVTDLIVIFFTDTLVKVFLQHVDIVFEVVSLLTHLLLVLLDLVV